MNLDTLNRGELFTEISELARAEGIRNKEDWKNMVDEVVESHLDIAELNPDQDLVGIKTELTDMWEEYRAEAGEESPAAIAEDPEEPKA